MIYCGLGPGQVVGELQALKGQLRSADVLTLEDGFVASMPGTRFCRLLVARPTVMQAMQQIAATAQAHLNSLSSQGQVELV